MYHVSLAGMIGVGMMVVLGATLAVATKFSARRWWDDVHAYKATVVQYIGATIKSRRARRRRKCVVAGELCRYLVASPPHPLERKHNVRLAIGNGLRPDIWTQFQERFGMQ